MENPGVESPPLAEASKQVARRLFIIMENRLQLFILEVEEERERVLMALWLTLGLAVFGLMTLIAVTVAVVLALWQYSPALAVGMVIAVYGAATGLCYAQLFRLLRQWQTLPATLDQLRKDRECLEKHLE
jgi:uncharacterized membrane protein YqjE